MLYLKIALAMTTVILVAIPTLIAICVCQAAEWIAVKLGLIKYRPDVRDVGWMD